MEAPPAYRASELPSPSTHWDTISTVEIRRDSPMGGRQHKSGGHDSSTGHSPKDRKVQGRVSSGNYINSTYPPGQTCLRNQNSKKIPKHPRHPKFRTPSPHPHLVCLHDATEIPRPKPEKISHAVGDSATQGAGRERRKPRSCPLRALCYPLAAIPKNGRQRIFTEGGCEVGRSQAPPDGRGGIGSVGATAHGRSHQRSSPPRSWHAGQHTGNLKSMLKFYIR